MGRKIITKADVILAIVLLVLGLGSPFLLRGKDSGESRVVITADGRELGNYALSEDRTVAVTGDADGELRLVPGDAIGKSEVLNLIVIENGSVRVEEASCKGQDCVRMGAISKNGQVIACLPHKLLISVAGGGEAPDAIIK